MVYTILVADDDPEILKIVKEELEAKKYQVVTAINGLVASHLAQTQHIDLIILDVAMPMASGLKVFDKLRSHPQTQNIPVIFMTGVPSADVYPTVAHGTRVAYIKKPVDLVELDSLILKFLQDYSPP